MLKILFKIVLMLCFISTTAFGQQIKLKVPRANKPIIDGNISEGEWISAKRLAMQGGEYVAFQKADDTLYVAVKGKAGGFCSLALGGKDNFRILHSSTGLITAEYKRENNAWKRVYDFKDPLTDEGKQYARGSVRLGNAYRKSKLEQFQWYSNLVDMGDPSETEYKIPLSDLDEGNTFVSVVFFQIKAQVKLAKMPQNLSDDCLDRELVGGSAGEGLQFKPQSWIQLIIN